jgi:hypothetical protein
MFKLGSFYAWQGLEWHALILTGILVAMLEYHEHLAMLLRSLCQWFQN